ncbi:MAG TPA: hypothetical protein VMU36_01300 [Spirochaetia bacterium]|nr:hypothetical protein [Spirochaetia bacterium]
MHQTSLPEVLERSEDCDTVESDEKVYYVVVRERPTGCQKGRKHLLPCGGRSQPSPLENAAWFHLADHAYSYYTLVELPGRDAEKAELGWVHDEQWLRAAERTRGRRGPYWTPIRPPMRARSTLPFAPPAAFALVRPPGHHAEAGLRR